MRILLCYIVCLFALVSSAQEKRGVIYQRYDKSDGLSNNNIGNITQDQNGFIWIASRNALQRFDGHYFRTFTTTNEPELLNNNISNVYCDSQNRLWIYYAFKGIGLWDLNTGEKQNFTPQLNNNTSLPDHRVFDFYEDQAGDIWLSIHSQGIARYNEQTNDFQLFKIDKAVPQPEKRDVNTVRTMIDHPTNKNELLVGSFNGLFILNKKNEEVRQIPINKANAENPENINGHEDAILDIHIQNDSTLWLATFGGGILKYDLKTETYRSIKLESAFPNNQSKNNFHHISKRDENSLWVTIWSKGLYILDLRSEELKMVNEKANGTSEIPTALKLLQGKFGHLWISTYKGLLKVYTEKGFTDYKYLGYPIEDIERDESSKQILVLPEKSDRVNIYNEKWKLLRSVKYESKRQFDINILEGLHNYKQKFYIQGFEGLYILNSSLTKIEPVPAFFEELNDKGRLSIISSFIDSKGNLWIGTKAKGIYSFDISEEKLTHYSPQLGSSQPHTDRWIFDFYEDNKGNIWFGTEAGFGFFNPESQSFFNFPYPENSSDLDNIYLKECVGFANNTGNDIWVASRESGLALFDNKNFFEPKVMLKSDTYFNNELVNKIIERKDKLYVQLKQGLSIVDKNSYDVKTFSKAFGVNQIQNTTKNGELVIGNGFASPSKFEYDNLTPPKIYVDDLLIAGKRQTYNKKGIHIPFEKNSLSLRLGVIDLIEKERAQLQYSLGNSEQTEWTSANSGQLLSFPYLDNGKYELKVRAISPSGKVWDEIQIPIEIIPMFWQRSWVRILIVLILVSLITFPLIYRYRQKKQARELKLAYEKEIEDLKRKALKAQVNPHFLFNSLNSIRLLVMKGNTEDASEGISTFSRLVRTILNHSERDEISLKEEIQSAEEYVKLEQMRFKEPFEFEVMIDSDVQLDSIYIPPMLIQPFLENAIWHGLRYKDSNGKLSIKIEKDNKNKNFIIFIRDNGIGREASAKFTSETKKSFGIKISSERLKHFNDSKIDDIYIHDLKNKNSEARGTLVEIMIRYK